MSLKVAAKYLAAHGRGPDDQLVHMSSKEVAGLESIAKAMGGSLTTNPNTGLTEAGFLDDVAPLVIGAGLAAATGGMSLGAELAGSELLAGLSPEILGGIGGLSNAALIGGGLGLAGTVLSGGNIGQGLRWGLGGYGGATAATAGMNYMNTPATPPATPLETAASTPGGAQAVTTQVAPAGTPAVQPAVNTPYGPIYNTTIPTELPPSSTPLSDTMYQDYGPKGVGETFSTTAATPAPGPSYFDKALDWAAQNPGWAAAGIAAPFLLKKPSAPTGTSNPQMIRPHTYTRNAQVPANMIGASYVPGQNTSERQWFNPYYTAGEPYRAADGGIIALADGGMAAGGGPVERMSNQAAIGANTMYPMANMTTSAFGTPFQTPQPVNMLAPSGGGTVDQMSGEPNMQGTRLAAGGLSTLGGYSDGGRLLRGPGDGVSDSIPAQIGDKQPARLADGEFVVPARIVSELGNGSTDAGARQLYKMMDRVQQARGKTTGKSKVAKNTNAAKYLPA